MIQSIIWKKIRIHFSKSFQSSLHVTIASVNSEGTPSATPIGTFFLNSDQTGYYFEKFPKRIKEHAVTSTRICVLAVNSSKYFWIKALYRNKFNHFPAVKLYGRLGALRKASSAELDKLSRRMKRTKGLKGNKYLWEDMDVVREIFIEGYEIANLGVMTDDLNN